MGTLARVDTRDGRRSVEALKDEVRRTGLFHDDWYRSRYYPEIRYTDDLLVDYLIDGAEAGRNPNPYFDVAWYCAAYPEAGEPVRCLLHYSRRGWKRGHRPCAHFDPQRYISAYPDVRESGAEPLKHYLHNGYYEQRRIFPVEHPRSATAVEIARSGLFAEGWYRASHPDIGDNYVDAVEHFVIHGAGEGRRPNPLFDPDWYSRNCQAAGKGAELLLHYATTGWKEGLNPSPRFDGDRYLACYDDARTAAMCPLAHYLTIGVLDGRAIFAVTGACDERRKDGEADRSRVRVDQRLRLLLSGRSNGGRRAKKPRIGRRFDPSSLDIHWVIPGFEAGSGGHMVIFRVAALLESFGHRQTLWIADPGRGTAEEIRRDALMHFFPLRARFALLHEGFAAATGDVVLATGWETVAPVMRNHGFRNRMYFVQDYEPDFFPKGSNSLAAESTYRYDIDCLCSSAWLEDILRDRYGRWVRAFHYAADRGMFGAPPNARSERSPGEPYRIALYHRPATARRAGDLALLGLEELAARKIDFRADLFGGVDHPGELPFGFVHHGVLPEPGLADLYRTCDVGVVFSSTNPSLVPLEMMASGLPVVELDGESTRRVIPGNVVTLTLPEPASIADAIEGLLHDPERRQRQAAAARDWIGHFEWVATARTIEEAMVERVEERGFRRSAPRIQIAQDTVSVVIPTLNGGDALLETVNRVRRQRIRQAIEIVVVDSQSDDGTAEELRRAGDVRMITIDRADFSHGATRNLAVDAARGETVALLTQDALPVDDWWLGNLVTLLDTYPGAGGVFGRHFARPDASAFIKRDLMLHFDGFADGPIVVTKEDRTRLGSAWHYFSNNNSAIRRSVWKDMPFPDLPFGEDQVWARTILDAGYQKLYANRAAVYHSHEYDPDGIRARAAMEAGYFCRQFGYVLVASEEDLLEQLLVLNDIDMRWGSGRQLPQAEIDARLALNAARLRGLLDGYREARYGLDIEPPSPTELQPPPPSTRATGSPRGETGAPS